MQLFFLKDQDQATGGLYRPDGSQGPFLGPLAEKRAAAGFTEGNLLPEKKFVLSKKTFRRVGRSLINLIRDFQSHHHNFSDFRSGIILPNS